MVVTAYKGGDSFERVGIVGGIAGYYVSPKHSSVGDFTIWVEDTKENREMIQDDYILSFKREEDPTGYTNLLRNTGTRVQLANGSVNHPYVACERAASLLHSQVCTLSAEIFPEQGFSGSVTLALLYTSEKGEGQLVLSLDETILQNKISIELPKRGFKINGLNILGQGIAGSAKLGNLMLTRYQSQPIWALAHEDTAHYLYTGETTVIIKRVLHKDEEGFNGIEASGSLLSKILSKRIVWGLYTNSNNRLDIAQDIINAMIISPVDTARKLPGVKLISLPPDTGQKQAYQQTGGWVEDAVYDLIKGTEYGITAIYDWYQKCIWLYLYRGQDRSVNQTLLPKIVFSRENSSLIAPLYIDDATAEKTTALIAGAGEAEDRQYESIGTEVTGWDRDEVYFDARDIQPTAQDGTQIPEEEYKELLRQRAIKRMIDYRRVTSFDSELSTMGAYTYGKDFFLGDIVTAKDTYTGITGTMRIEAIELSEDAQGEMLRLIVGESQTTFQAMVKAQLR